MDTGFIVSNAMAFSPDGKTLVFGDSRGETVWKYDLDTIRGELSNKRVYISTNGLPWRIDGATFDAQGYYWCALVGGGAVGRFDPEVDSTNSFRFRSHIQPCAILADPIWMCCMSHQVRFFE